jgi:hypothetical protein
MTNNTNGFNNVMLPLIRNVIPKLIASDIVGVQPMTSGVETVWDREYATFMVLDSGEKVYCSHVYKLNRYKHGEYESFAGKCVSEEEYFLMTLEGTEKEDERIFGQTGEIFKLGISNKGVGKV